MLRNKLSPWSGSEALNPLWLVKEVKVNILTGTLKNSLSSKLNDRKNKLSKLNVKRSDKRIERKKT